jgi:hypothetical protein
LFLKFLIFRKGVTESESHHFAVPGIPWTNFADFILDLRNCYAHSHLGIGFTHLYRLVKATYIISFFWRGTGLFIVCLTVWEKAGMPENNRCMNSKVFITQFPEKPSHILGRSRGAGYNNHAVPQHCGIRSILYLTIHTL